MGPLIVALLNMLTLLGAAGFLYYSKFLYKKPEITEGQERTQLIQNKGQIARRIQSEEFLYNIPPLTLNIRGEPLPSEVAGFRNHYATMSITLRMKTAQGKEPLEEIKPVLMDRLIQLFGTKSFQELNQVQGRYLVRAEIADMINSLLGETIVMDVYFTEFIIR